MPKPLDSVPHFPAALRCPGPHHLYPESRIGFLPALCSFRSAHQPSEEYSLNGQLSTPLPCNTPQCPQPSPVELGCSVPGIRRLAPAFHPLVHPQLLVSCWVPRHPAFTFLNPSTWHSSGLEGPHRVFYLCQSELARPSRASQLLWRDCWLAGVSTGGSARHPTCPSLTPRLGGAKQTLHKPEPASCALPPALSPRTSHRLPSLPVPPFPFLVSSVSSFPFFSPHPLSGPGGLSQAEDSQDPSRPGDVPELASVEGLCNVTLGKALGLFGPQTLTCEMGYYYPCACVPSLSLP